MKYIKYNKVYGEKSFKTIMLVVKRALVDLKEMKECWEKDDNFESRTTIEIDVFAQMRTLHPLFLVVLKMDNHILDPEETKVFKWASSICKIIYKKINTLEDEDILINK